jgi:F420-0:gamma-glutamyl ligase
MQHWYVYYKLPRTQLSEIAARVRAMLKVICASTSVRGQLLRRDDRDAQTMTLMEQYDHIVDPVAFEAALTSAVRDSGLPAAIIEQRHVERFEEF